MVVDLVAKLLGNGLVIVAVGGKKRFDLAGDFVGVGVDIGFDLGLEERQVKHALVFVFAETKVVFDDFDEAFFATLDATNAEMALKFVVDLLLGNGDV